MIAFNWGTRGPDSNIPTTGFSVRWEGELKVEKFGYYRFYSDPINGKARVWLNDEMIID